MNRPQVAVVYPSRELMHADTTTSLLQLFAFDDGTLKIPFNPRYSSPACSRNKGVSAVLQFSPHWIFFVDSDMIIPPYALQRLVAHDKDIIGATYRRRSEPHDVLGTHLDQSLNDGALDLIEMEKMPTGCLLIRASVFDSLPRPWFRMTYQDNSDDEGGEDYYFCQMARAHGFQIWCDQPLSRDVVHIGTQYITIPR